MRTRSSFDQQPDHILVAGCASLRHGGVILPTAPPIEGMVGFIHSDEYGRSLIIRLLLHTGATGALVELADRMQGVPTFEVVVDGNAGQKFCIGGRPQLGDYPEPIDVEAIARLHSVDPNILKPLDRLGNRHTPTPIDSHPGTINLRQYE